MPDDIEQAIERAFRRPGIKFRSNRPEFSAAPVGRSALVSWWAGWDVFPARVAVTETLDSWTPAKLTPCDCHPGLRLLSRTFRFAGFGSVVVVGPVDGAEAAGVPQVLTVPEAGAARYVGGLVGGIPGWAGGRDYAEVIALGLGRLNVVMLGMLAQCYLDSPALLGGPHPVLRKHLESWDAVEGVVVRTIPEMTDLRHPDTW